MPKAKRVGLGLSRRFGPKQKPWEMGVYKTWPPLHDKHGAYQFWNGVHWCGWASDIQTALQNVGHYSMSQNHKWQGLAENPKP